MGNDELNVNAVQSQRQGSKEKPRGKRGASGLRPSKTKSVSDAYIIPLKASIDALGACRYQNVKSSVKSEMVFNTKFSVVDFVARTAMKAHILGETAINLAMKQHSYDGADYCDRWIAYDIDARLSDDDLHNLLKNAWQLGISLYVCDSTSRRGHHLWVFIEPAHIPLAEREQQIMKHLRDKLARVLGIKHDTQAVNIIAPFANHRPLLDNRLKTARDIKKTSLATLLAVASKFDAENSIIDIKTSTASNFYESIPKNVFADVTNCRSDIELHYVAIRVYPTSPAYRHYLAKLIGEQYLVKFGYSLDDTLKAIRELCQLKHDHEVNDRLAQVQDSYRKLETGKKLSFGAVFPPMFYSSIDSSVPPSARKHSAENRLLAFLLRHQIYQPTALSNRYLADLLAMNKETVNRTIKNLAERGVIVQIVNRDKTQLINLTSGYVPCDVVMTIATTVTEPSSISVASYVARKEEHLRQTDEYRYQKRLKKKESIKKM